MREKIIYVFSHENEMRENNSINPAKRAKMPLKNLNTITENDGDDVENGRFTQRYEEDKNYEEFKRKYREAMYNPGKLA